MALDGNLKWQVEDFANERGLSVSGESAHFEAYVTYLLLRKHHRMPNHVLSGRNVESYVTGGGGDGALDSIGILVDGNPIFAKEDLATAFRTGGPNGQTKYKADVEFIFVQAKTASSFKASDIGDFGDGVAEFFEGAKGNEPQLNFNNHVHERIAIAHAIFSNSDYRISMRKAGGPKCALYFATAGTWNDDHDPALRFKKVRQSIPKLDLGFEDENVQAHAIDKKALAEIERALRLAVKSSVPYEEAISFPKIRNVEKAHIVLMKAKAFIDLVSTVDGELNEDLFYDNLRDYQGHNEVNSEIRNTLATPQTRDAFPLLNNGITIVARQLDANNKVLDVSDYQIVNGCQTTHVLFQNKEHIPDSTFVPVKFVVSQDRQMIENVITATNRQTLVEPETFESLKPFHKDLEDTYVIREKSIPDSNDRLYYERRSMQYAYEAISQRNIVTLQDQTLSFVSMFLEAPHHHERNYGPLLQNEYKEQIFQVDHKCEPYYASGVALKEVGKWTTDKPDLHMYRHHLLLLARLSAVERSGTATGTATRFNSRNIVDYAMQVVSAIRDEQKGSRIWRRAAELLQQALDSYPGDTTEAHKTEAFTKHLLELVQQARESAAEAKPGRRASELAGGVPVPFVVAEADDERDDHGTILWFDIASRYGRIRTRAGRELFVDEWEIREVPLRLRVEGTQVMFEIGPAPVAGAQMVAKDVLLVENEQDETPTS